MNLPIQEMNGLKFYYRPGTTDEKVIIEVVKRHNYSHKDIFDISPADCWLDLGGNIGTFTCLVASKGCNVVTYEPEPECFEILRENVALNGLGQLVELHQQAVADKGGSLGLYLSKGQNKYRHTLFEVRGREKIEIEAVKFQDILSEKFTAVKMDIEGSELAIFDAVEDWGNVKKLAFEYHFDFDRSIPNFEKRMNKLRETFTNMRLPKMPADKLTYDFFPSGKTVICSR